MPNPSGKKQSASLCMGEKTRICRSRVDGDRRAH
uniref:Uncharacterized protein n=1 Tax=Arundo donax TaxID=35708 RepID=A0A0A9GI35_ARUDO